MQQNQHKSIRDTSVGGDFNFDEWKDLYASDPEAFEQRRQVWIDDLIESAPTEYQRRLRGLMFRIDMERQRSGSALDACMRISSLMWDRFGDLKSHLNAMANPQSGMQLETAVVEEQPARVLAFRGRD